MSTMLLRLSVKVIGTKINKELDYSSCDNYAVIWVRHASWDKYNTSNPIKNSHPVELFLHKPSDLHIEVFDSGRKIVPDRSFGVSSLQLFDIRGNLLFRELESTDTLTLNLYGPNNETFGTVDVVLLMHFAYRAPQSPMPNYMPIYPFRNLVLEGGGVRGIAYGGSIECLEQRGIIRNILRIGGTSAGAIAGLLLALGGTAAMIRQAMESIDYLSFRDGNIVSNMGLGLYSGEALSAAIRLLISQFLTARGITPAQFGLSSLEDVTFRNLLMLHQDPRFPGVFKQFYAIGTKVSLSPARAIKLDTLDLEVFSPESTPDFPLWQATRISMGVPFYFKPIFKDGKPYVDGGVLYNYAINIFDQNGVANYETLGLRVDTPQEIAKFLDGNNTEVHARMEKFKQGFHHKTNFSDLKKRIANEVKDHLSIYKPTKADDGRSIYINTGSIETTQFEITPEMRQGLIQYGREWCECFFTWWDHQYMKNPSPTGPIEAAGMLQVHG
eukprot:TRINITY_DN287_c1_g1_i1.p1 TRINITY_DN287_c1_g1~~TRINITY_DN287_c1_g1_i1.p1  ORF type:complete len:498 (+),score=62.98 TRINITY_DN287_c1_g1_i1:63-1556(+)